MNFTTEEADEILKQIRARRAEGVTGEHVPTEPKPQVTDEQMKEIIARDHDCAIRDYLHASRTNNDKRQNELWKKLWGSTRMDDWHNAQDWFNKPEHKDTWFTHDHVWLYAQCHDVLSEPTEEHQARAFSQVIIRHQELKDLEEDGNEMAGELRAWIGAWLWERSNKWDLRTRWEIREAQTLPDNWHSMSFKEKQTLTCWNTEGIPVGDSGMKTADCALGCLHDKFKMRDELDGSADRRRQKWLSEYKPEEAEVDQQPGPFVEGSNVAKLLSEEEA